MIFEKIKQIIMTELKIEEQRINKNSNLSSDLDADSLDCVEIVMALQEEFDIKINDEEAQNLKTINDIVIFIENRLK